MTADIGNMQVHVWAVDVSMYSLWSQADKGEATLRSYVLDDKECDKIRRYVREEDQIRSLAGKLLARSVICSLFVDISWDKLRFAVAESGRPYLAHPHLPIDYNITHDGDWVAIVFARQDGVRPYAPSIGIDVMEIQLPHFEKDVESFVNTMDMTLTEAERRWILQDALSDHEKLMRQSKSEDHVRLLRLYTLWTFKEAFTKSRGLGLSFDFAKIELALWDRHCPTTTTYINLARFQGNAAMSDQSSTACTFQDMMLPSGKLHTLGQGAERKHHFGKGHESLLVIARPQNRDEERQIPMKTLSTDEAQRQGLLQVMTMDDLMIQCHSLRARQTSERT